MFKNNPKKYRRPPFFLPGADEGVVGAGVLLQLLLAVVVPAGDLVDAGQVGVQIAHFLEQFEAVLTEDTAVDLGSGEENKR